MILRSVALAVDIYEMISHSSKMESFFLYEASTCRDGSLVLRNEASMLRNEIFSKDEGSSSRNEGSQLKTQFL